MALKRYSMKEWYLVDESERPVYLSSRAAEMARSCGISVKQAAEALCAVWNWDIKKYKKGLGIEENEGALAGL